MPTSDGLKEYVGYIWIGAEPGKRISVVAQGPAEAKSLVDAEYGEGHVTSIWNEADANRPRDRATPATVNNSCPPLPGEINPGQMTATTLFRPVGQPELDLIAASGWRRLPPRLDWQPIFYPVTNEPYATRIARDWNTKDDENGNVGYVLRFDVDSTYLSQFDVQQVGDEECLEYWIPADELDSFNDRIVGAIEVISEWRA